MPSKSGYKIHDLVDVYRMWESTSGFEGRAEIMEIHQDTETEAYCQVQFVGADTLVYRWLLARKYVALHIAGRKTS